MDYEATIIDTTNPTAAGLSLAVCLIVLTLTRHALLEQLFDTATVA